MYHCLVERARIDCTKDNWILINGATGGMGFAAVQLAKHLGLKVIATGGSDEKLSVVQAVTGAEHVVNYTSQPEYSAKVKQLTNGQGVDVVFDPVGGTVFEQALKSTSFGARVCVVGFTSGVHPKILANYVLIKCLTVIGCRAGEYVMRKDSNRVEQRMREMLQLAEASALTPNVSALRPFTSAGVRDAFSDLLNRKVIGRVCVDVGGTLSSL